MKYATISIMMLLAGCQSSQNITEEQPQATVESVKFESVLLSDQANLWWARTLGDINGDGILDIILQDNNGSGGWLGYLEGQEGDDSWPLNVMFESAPGGGKFAAGDLEAGDMDGDGDLDLIGVEHPGEWTDADADAVLYIYYQDEEGWRDARIGEIPSALKDISLADLDGDGSLEVVTVTYNAETLSVFTRLPDGSYALAWDLVIDNLHEGLDIGDLDGDGMNDIAANGYWLKNPGSLQESWPVDTIDARWFNQEEDHWARNATKIVCRDVDNDDKAEVFISHSEKDGYPLMRYDWEKGSWHSGTILGNLSAAHSLVVEDIDLDGDFEVLTGVNRNRAIGIAEEKGVEPPAQFPVLLINETGGIWLADTISTEGVYNLLAGDVEGDGDIDLIRLTSHDMKDMWLMRNQVR